MRRILMMMTLLLALTACGQGGTADEPTTPPVDPIVGDLSTEILGDWRALEIGGKELILGSTITFQFKQDGQAGGRACNNIGGSYAVDGEGLRFGALEQTEMACIEPAGVMEQETRFAQALASASSARIEGNILRLFDAAGQEVLVFTRM